MTLLSKKHLLSYFDKKIYKYEFYIKPVNDIRINEYKSSAIRGFLGLMLKKILCPLKRNYCISCDLRLGCQYFNFFENTKVIDKDDAILSRDLYRPYIIYSSDNRTIIQANDYLKFEITLFGDNSNQKMPYLILAFKEGGVLYGFGSDRTKFTLDKVIDKVKNKNILTNKDVKIPSRGFNIIQTKKESNRLKIRFLTPLILKNNISLDEKFLIFNILKRGYLISKYYMNNKEFTYQDYEDLKSYFENLLKEVKVERNSFYDKTVCRYSNRKKKKMYFKGLVGEMELSGRIDENILDLLKFGEFMHVGKNCSFGFGKISLEVDDE